MRNKVKNEVHKIRQFKQESIARLTKSNPKHFWKYIKSKSSRNINVGEINLTEGSIHVIQCNHVYNVQDESDI